MPDKNFDDHKVWADLIASGSKSRRDGTIFTLCRPSGALNLRYVSPTASAVGYAMPSLRDFGEFKIGSSKNHARWTFPWGGHLATHQRERQVGLYLG
jgi:hypothetical protein